MWYRYLPFQEWKKNSAFGISFKRFPLCVIALFFLWDNKTKNKIMVVEASHSKKGSLVSFQHSSEMASFYQKASSQVQGLIKIYSQYSIQVFTGMLRKKCLVNHHNIASALTREDPPKVSVRGYWQIPRSFNETERHWRNIYFWEDSNTCWCFRAPFKAYNLRSSQ